MKASTESQQIRRELNMNERRSLLDETTITNNSGGLSADKIYSNPFEQSCMVSSRKMKTTEIYDKVMGFERPVAVFFYGLFLILCPLVFRYALYSSNVVTTVKSHYGLLGNSSMSISTDWSSCQQCLGWNGFTLSSLTIETLNVTDPNIRAGYPSIAIFVSQDFKQWYNFYEATDLRAPFIQSWSYSSLSLNQSNGAACLGNIYNNYLVACLNIQNLANKLKKGDPIQGPPFNDRCFQLAGVCGVPCSTLSGQQYPPHCHNGHVNPSDLVTNSTFDKTTVTGTKWGSTLTPFDWLVLITIFFDTVGNILRFMPILCGRPTDIEAAKSVQCSGVAIIGNGTPIVSENEAIFLRGMVGRTLCVFHTIGGRHDLRSIYIDTIINEFRGKNQDKRTQMWCAWMQFIEVLATMKTRQMSWEHNLSDRKSEAPSAKGNGAQLFEANKNKRVMRSLRIRRDMTVQWDCSLANVKFEGIATTKASYSDGRFGFDHQGENPLRAKSYDSSIISPELVHSDTFNNHKLTPSRVHVHLEDILPLICFLDGWLEEIKQKDPTYNYKDKTEALKAIFNDAPSQKYFYGEQLLEVQERLLLLFDIFNGDKVQPVPEEGFSGYKKSPENLPIHRDEVLEVVWTVTRFGLPDWQVAWNYFSRARVKPMKPSDNEEDYYEDESTRVKNGTIVHVKVPDDVAGVQCLERWLKTRAETYKVLETTRDVQGQMLKLLPWPPSADVENAQGKAPIIRSYENVALIEKNRGKAGALNVFAEYLRLRGRTWAAQHDIPTPVQTIAAIVDARHMLSEPHIFINEALPFFARLEKGNAYGKATDVILIQYPQFFSNVIRDDFLDNKNSGYYTIWQTLRDCAKTITSSGTNALWDITDSGFTFATSSRIEDTGTSQMYLAKYLTVHLPCFVAYGIAKDTEDYIEAVYRWSCGAVELFWATFFSQQFTEYCVIASITIIFAMASFSEYSFMYFVWIAFLFFMGISAYWEKSNGLRPLRSLNVSATISMNTMYWISNLSSPVWGLIVPFRIAVYSAAPISGSTEQSLTWAFVSLIVRLPIGIVTDRIINMASFLSPKTKKDSWNFSMVLWRSSQLFVCSFAYTLLSLINGTQTAYRARFHDGDNTMWSSFRVSSDEVTRLRKKMQKAPCFTKEYFDAAYGYYRLQLLRVYLSFNMPDVITTWLAMFLFMMQFVMIFLSIALVNVHKPSYILTSIIVCSLNTFLVADIAFLLFPKFSEVIGNPPRLEYLFAILSTVIIVSLLMNDNLHDIGYYLKVF